MGASFTGQKASVEWASVAVWNTGLHGETAFHRRLPATLDCQRAGVQQWELCLVDGILGVFPFPQPYKGHGRKPGLPLLSWG